MTLLDEPGTREFAICGDVWQFVDIEQYVWPVVRTTSHMVRCAPHDRLRAVLRILTSAFGIDGTDTSRRMARFAEELQAVLNQDRDYFLSPSRDASIPVKETRIIDDAATIATRNRGGL